jgi:hypothetical protein
MTLMDREPLPWLAQYAESTKLRYEPEADERWIRVWEPLLTVAPAYGFSNALSMTSDERSVTMARMMTEGFGRRLYAWAAFVQDTRVLSRLGTPVATTSDANSPFCASQVAGSTRRMTGDQAFDQVFRSYAAEEAMLGARLGTGVRSLLLGWRVSLHLEVRNEGFALVFPQLPADPPSIAWMFDAIVLLGRKIAEG